MVDEFEVTLVLRQARGHRRRYIVENLSGSGFHDMHRTVADPHHGAVRLSSRRLTHREGRLWRRGEYSLALGNNGFEQLYRRLLCSSSNIAGTNIMVVGKDARCFSIDINTLDPVLFERSLACSRGRLLRCEPCPLLTG